MTRIVVLDGYVANPGDLTWEGISNLGELTVYDRSRPEDIVDRAREADIILTNKCVLGANEFAELPRLKMIGLLATGYNVIDVMAAREAGIDVCNAVGYSSPSVAQHVFAMILNLNNEIALHNQSVNQGDWSNSKDWTYNLSPLVELRGQTMGILGFGKIGQEVGKLALAFGMKVIASHRHPQRDNMEGISFGSWKEVCQQADYISLHVPLNPQTQAIVNKDSLNLMKENAVLINTGRGGLIEERDLAEALLAKQIRGACLDVLSEEPPQADHPLIGLENCRITPHIAWATQASRKRLLKIVEENISSFLKGNPQNVVN
ncbi:MAG: D-2-hydroxyacid dehydrogenase [Bacteroidota bacterium]